VELVGRDLPGSFDCAEELDTSLSDTGHRWGETGALPSTFIAGRAWNPNVVKAHNESIAYRYDDGRVVFAARLPRRFRLN
jgi:hypothetical protein